MRLGIASVACALVALVSAGAAGADDLDDDFIDSLTAQGITGDREQLIADGHATCATYGTLAANDTLMHLMGRGLTNVQAGNVMLAALGTYCPQRIPPG